MRLDPIDMQGMSVNHSKQNSLPQIHLRGEVRYWLLCQQTGSVELALHEMLSELPNVRIVSIPLHQLLIRDGTRQGLPMFGGTILLIERQVGLSSTVPKLLPNGAKLYILHNQLLPLQCNLP